MYCLDVSMATIHIKVSNMIEVYNSLGHLNQQIFPQIQKENKLDSKVDGGNVLLNWLHLYIFSHYLFFLCSLYAKVFFDGHFFGSDVVCNK